MDFRWAILPQRPATAKLLARELGVSTMFAQCLINRGLDTTEKAQRFLDPQFEYLASPLEIPNMTRAVERLIAARETGETIVIFGDTDVDGLTSTALLIEVMEELGWRLDYYLPRREQKGYGLSRAAVEHCCEQFAPDVILAVDCGSTSWESIQWLKERGVDVIVLDHHQLFEPVPPAVALVNPLLNGGKFSELSSVGLAYKLAQALVAQCQQLNRPPSAKDFDLISLLELVALGTVADLVPLVRENRIMVALGLNRLNQTRRAGLLALMEVAQVRHQIDVFDISSVLGPRINASGRIEDPAASLELIRCVDDMESAKEQALNLEACNRRRQSIEKEILEDAIAELRRRFDAQRDFVIVAGNRDWHIGVVGIVAVKVLREFYRPTIILGGGENGNLRGSGRSVAGFDLAAALRECDDLLEDHGGHAMAAGLSIDPRKLSDFRQRINLYAKGRLSRDSLVQKLRLDLEVTPSAMSLAQVEELSGLRPFGVGNDSMQFSFRNVRLKGQPHRMGKDNQHVKFWVTDSDGTNEVLWWNCGDRPLPTGRFHLAFTPQINEVNGHRLLQLKLLHWRPSGKKG